MGIKIDIQVGNRFGDWTVVGTAENSKAGKTRSACKCQCGKDAVIVNSSLISGKSKRCRSCAAKSQKNVERVRLMRKPKKHGMCGTRIYNIWCAMIARCDNPNNSSYKNYGGRGISYQRSWSTFCGFYSDMGDSYFDLGTIERIDTNKGYSKDNCKWATMKEQTNNKRNNFLILFNGVEKTMQQWSDELGFSNGLIRDRLSRGWSIEDALTMSPSKRKYKDRIKDE